MSEKKNDPVARLEASESRFSTREAALRRAQERVERYLPEGVSLADELIAERRNEAA